jgi:tyrosine-protein kinase Etk/Wzc
MHEPKDASWPGAGQGSAPPGARPVVASPGASAESSVPDVNLVDVLMWLGWRRRLIASITAAAAVLGLTIAFILPNVYTARSLLLPPNNPSGGGGASALAALGALGGLTGGVPMRTPDELYAALLRGDSILRTLDERFSLKKRLDADTFEELRIEVQKVVRVVIDKRSGIITVEVDDEEPEFAAVLANAYSAELSVVAARLAVSEAQQRRRFFDDQVRQTKERLVQAEDAMRVLQESSGVIVLDKQAAALIEGAATIRASIAEREVQLRVLRVSSTDQNPAVQRLAAEIRALRSELTRMESSTSGGTPGSAVDMPVARIPAAAVDYIRARRELKLQETLLEGMLRQFEIAKLDEAKEGPAIQLVEAAIAPDRKSKPKRAVLILGALVSGFFIACLYAISRGYLEWRQTSDPASSVQHARLLAAWRSNRRT